MMYVLYAILAVIAVLLGIAVVRALMIKAPAVTPCDTAITEEECATAAQKLGAMVQIPSVSKREDEDLSEFYKLHAVMEEQFPLIHQKLTKEVLNAKLLITADDVYKVYLNGTFIGEGPAQSYPFG